MSILSKPNQIKIHVPELKPNKIKPHAFFIQTHLRLVGRCILAVTSFSSDEMRCENPTKQRVGGEGMQRRGSKSSGWRRRGTVDAPASDGGSTVEPLASGNIT
jgi:hypothetical protein